MLQMAGAIAAEMLDALFGNFIFLFLYVLVIIYIRAQYQKYSELQSAVYGKPGKSIREIAEQIILSGLIAGFAASFLTVAAGVTIEADTTKYLLYIMCLLLIIDLRLVCISYAAGILAAVSLIFGRPQISIPSLLCLVAVLQVTEGFLIWLNKKGGCVPVFIKHKDEIAGAYLIRRFWMVPIVFFTYLMQPGIVLLDFADGLPMFFKSPSFQGGVLALGMDCFAAILCHTDITITKHPEKKSIQAARMTFGYSIVLLMIAFASIDIIWMRYIGVAFCVLGHEAIYFYSRYSEKAGMPIYSAVRRGLRIMDILPGSHAELMGLERGDIILSINKNDIQTDEGVSEALQEFPCYTWIRVIGWDQKERTVEYRCFPGGYNTLGIISVPREKEVTYKTEYFERISILQNIVNRFRGADKMI